MRLRIALTISLGRDRPKVEAVDHVGTHHDPKPTELYLGFTNGRETDD